MIDKMIEEMKEYQLYAIRNAIMGIDVAKHCIAIAEKYKADKCHWIHYDYRTICPKEHDSSNPYWRIPKDMDNLKYCPYCGKKIKVGCD